MHGHILISPDLIIYRFNRWDLEYKNIAGLISPVVSASPAKNMHHTVFLHAYVYMSLCQYIVTGTQMYCHVLHEQM